MPRTKHFKEQNRQTPKVKKKAVQSPQFAKVELMTNESHKMSDIEVAKFLEKKYISRDRPERQARLNGWTTSQDFFERQLNNIQYKVSLLS